MISLPQMHSPHYTGPGLTVTHFRGDHACDIHFNSATLSTCTSLRTIFVLSLFRCGTIFTIPRSTAVRAFRASSRNPAPAPVCLAQFTTARFNLGHSPHRLIVTATIFIFCVLHVFSLQPRRAAIPLLILAHLAEVLLFPTRGIAHPLEYVVAFHPVSFLMGAFRLPPPFVYSRRLKVFVFPLMFSRDINSFPTFSACALHAGRFFSFRVRLSLPAVYRCFVFYQPFAFTLLRTPNNARGVLSYSPARCRTFHISISLERPQIVWALPYVFLRDASIFGHSGTASLTLPVGLCAHSLPARDDYRFCITHHSFHCAKQQEHLQTNINGRLFCGLHFPEPPLSTTSVFSSYVLCLPRFTCNSRLAQAAPRFEPFHIWALVTVFVADIIFGTAPLSSFWNAVHFIHFLSCFIPHFYFLSVDIEPHFTGRLSPVFI